MSIPVPAPGSKRDIELQIIDESYYQFTPDLLEYDDFYFEILDVRAEVAPLEYISLEYDDYTFDSIAKKITLNNAGY